MRTQFLDYVQRTIEEVYTSLETLATQTLDIECEERINADSA